ncbi:MAG: division/cell wall cluster transcriptional repressor MraZ [Anaerolineaceae bacterium]
MFLGRYDHTIDEKGRITVPARFRELLEDGAYITRGLDKNLMILTSSSFDVMSDRVTKMSVTNPLARDLRRVIFSGADRVDVDRAGRMLIPAFLRDYAQLGTSVTVVGSGDYLEIWSTESWQAQDQRLEASETNAERFAALDLSTS